ncbi:MAG: diacylglycerol/polyprenol kinase family protein [Planctomycetota bacterium]|jgi:dolichol kinase
MRVLVTSRIARKFFHLSGVVIVLAYHGLGPDRALMAGVLWFCVLVLGGLDLLRSRLPAVQERFRALFRLLLDPKDERGLNGSTLYFAGCALAVTLVPPEPACGGILALVLGDPAAAVVGSAVRSPRWKRVSVAGSVACLVAATLACRLFATWPAALCGGGTATALEALSGTKLDNLTIPVGTALVLHLAATSM